MSGHRPSPQAAAIGTIALVTGMALRVGAMSGRELWLDETHSALLAAMPIGERLTFVMGDVHPPLYFFLLGVWTRLLGDGPTVLRAFSLAAATLALVLLALATARFLQRAAAGVCALALAAASPILVYYSFEVRMYALATLFTVAALLLLPDPHRPLGEQRLRAAGFVLSGALTFYTHYMGIFAIAGMCVWILIQTRRNRAALSRAVGLTLATALLIAPWTPVLLRQREAKAELRRQELAGAADPLALNYGNRRTLAPGLGWQVRSVVQNVASAAGASSGPNRATTVFLTIPVGLAGLGVLVAGVRGAPASQLALLVTAATLLGCAAIGAVARRFLILAVPFWLLAFTELALILWRRRPWLAVGFVGSLLGVYGYGTIRVIEAPHPRPLETLVKRIQTSYRPGELIVFNAAYGEIPFRYYAHREALEVKTRGFPIDIREWWSGQPFKGWGGPVVSTADLAAFVEEVQRDEAGRTVWLALFDTRYYDPGDSLLTVMSRHALSRRELVDTAGHRLVALRLRGTEPPPEGRPH